MSTVRPPDEQPSVGELVRQASEHVSTLVRGEVELAKAELTGTVKRAGIGGGLLGGGRRGAAASRCRSCSSCSPRGWSRSGSGAGWRT